LTLELLSMTDHLTSVARRLGFTLIPERPPCLWKGVGRDFCPDGYLPILEAIAAAARRWFADRVTALEKAATSQQGEASD